MEHASALRAFDQSLQRLGLDHVFDFALSEEQMAQIATLDRGQLVGPDPDTFTVGG